MTEASYQQARILMRQITHLKSQISKHKKAVATCGNQVSEFNAKGDDAKAIAALEKFNFFVAQVEAFKATMAAIVFPPPNLPDEVIGAKFCRICQTQIGKSEEYCLDCDNNQKLAKYDFSQRKNMSE